MYLSIFAWMIHLSLAFLHLHAQEILLDLIVILWARTVIMLFLVLPSLELLDEEGEWDVLLGSSLLWWFQALNRRKCRVRTCKCLFQSPLAEILPAGLQQSALAEKLPSVLGLTWNTCAVAAASPRDLVWESVSLGLFLGLFWDFLNFGFFYHPLLNLSVNWSSCMQILKENAMLWWTWRNWKRIWQRN